MSSLKISEDGKTITVSHLGVKVGILVAQDDDLNLWVGHAEGSDLKTPVLRKGRASAALSRLYRANRS